MLLWNVMEMLWNVGVECYGDVVECCGNVAAWLSLLAAIEEAVAMPLACRCMNGGTCYTEGDQPKCK